MPRVPPREHFAEYTDNNRIKHEILTRYLRQYVTALSKHAGGFHYIDGFAGAGSYDGQPGSPVLAMEVLAGQLKTFSLSLVESDAQMFAELRKVMAACNRPARMLDDPLVARGQFSEHLNQILSRQIYSSAPNTATFAFLDPCRASGYGVEEVRGILERQFGECLIFWNYDGVNRWLGGLAAQQHSAAGLGKMFGSQEALDAALDIQSSTKAPPEKERELLGHFLQSLHSYSGAKYLIPFRFTSELANRTSHYLVHCSGHALAFRIMKDVMASVSSNNEPGQFSFLGANDMGNQLPLLFPEALSAARAAVLGELRKGAVSVKKFVEGYVERPIDLLRSKDYRDILLQLEAEGLIEVLDRSGGSPMPAASRRPYKGAPSLSPELVIRLVT